MNELVTGCFQLLITAPQALALQAELRWISLNWR